MAFPFAGAVSGGSAGWSPGGWSAGAEDLLGDGHRGECLRPPGVSCGRFHASPNSTLSVKCTSPGAKSPNIFSAPDGSLFSVVAAIGVLPWLAPRWFALG